MNQNNAAQLTGDEVRAAIKHAHNMSGPSDATQPAEYVLAGALALLSKLRAPKPLGDSCHHCGWMDWVSQDGQAYCQACGKPHGSVPAEGLPNLPELLRENADLDAAEGGNSDVIALECAAADEIERLRREVAKLRAPVADERAVPLSRYDYQTLFDAIGKAVKVHPNLAIEISVQAFRAALASAPVAGEAIGFIPTSEIGRNTWLVKGLEFRSVRDSIDDPTGQKWTRVYAAPQASEAVPSGIIDAARNAGFSFLRHADGSYTMQQLATATAQASEAVRSITFDDWLAKHCDSDDLTAYERELALDAWNAALMEPQDTPSVQEMVPVYAYRRKGLDYFVTCDRDQFDELSAKPRLFETRTFYADPEKTVEPLTLPGFDADRLRAIASSGSQTAMSNALLNVARALSAQPGAQRGDR